MNTDPPIWCSPPPVRFAYILALLRQMLGVVGYRRVNPALNLAAYARVGFLLRRFTQILAHPARIWPIKTRPTKTQPASPAPASPAPAPFQDAKLPTRFGWMLHLYPGHQIPGARSLLTHFLSEPDTIALLSANPRLGRVLRPLCHMLRIVPPPHLALPPRPKQPRPKQSQPKQPRRKSAPANPHPPLWGLPPIAAAAPPVSRTARIIPPQNRP